MLLHQEMLDSLPSTTSDDGLLNNEAHPAMMVANVLTSTNREQNIANAKELSDWYKYYAEMRCIAFGTCADVILTDGSRHVFRTREDATKPCDIAPGVLRVQMWDCFLAEVLFSV